MSHGAPHEIHRAGQVLVTPWHIIKNGWIYVVNHTIVDLCSGKSAAISFDHKIIDHGPGLLMPALVNAHTHFELSALKGKIPFHNGFNGWVRELIKQREQCGTDTLREGARKAVETAIKTGTLFFGEVSTLGITEDIFFNSDIGGVWFQEYLGGSEGYYDNSSVNLPNPSKSDRKKMLFSRKSIAGHAPHTTSPELLRLLKKKSKKANLPFSIHVGESDYETEFIKTGKGQWAEFLKERGIDYSSWQLPSRSPVQYLNDNGLLDPLTLAVHLVNVDTDDIEIIAKSQSRPVFCPRSNFNLHKALPDIPLFLKYGLKPALGTDSLASTETLNMFDEMLYVADHFPQINPSDILAMATINGADALGLGKTAATLEKGRRADFIYIPLNFTSSRYTNSIEDTIMSFITAKATH